MVFQKIRAIISSRLGLDEEDVAADTLLDDLDIDYLDLADIAMDIEDEFSIEMSDETLQGFDTVGDIVSYIEES